MIMYLMLIMRFMKKWRAAASFLVSAGAGSVNWDCCTERTGRRDSSKVRDCNVVDACDSLYRMESGLYCAGHTLLAIKYCRVHIRPGSRVRSGGSEAEQGEGRPCGGGYHCEGSNRAIRSLDMGARGGGVASHVLCGRVRRHFKGRLTELYLLTNRSERAGFGGCVA